MEVKRQAVMASVDQLARYLDHLNRDPLLAPVGGVLAALTIPPQVRVHAADHGIRCQVIDYDDLRGMAKNDLRLF